MHKKPDVSRVDLNLFTVFDAIWREGGLTRAAAQLHITQPAVSHALGRLREVCGDPLFVKVGRRMQPTPRARAMAPQVQQALTALGRTLDGPPGFDLPTAQRRFAIGLRQVQEPFVLQALQDLLPQLGTPAAPGLSLALVRMDRERLEDELRQGVLDLALDVHLPVSRHVGALQVMREPMVVLARADHPRLARGWPAGEAAALAAYLAEGHVAVSTRRAGLGLEDNALSLRGQQRRQLLRCQDYQAACAAVAATDWLLTLPRRHAQDACQQWGHRLLPAPCPMPALKIYLYWDHRLDADPANQWLRQTLIEGLGRSAPPEPA
ncbi:LysR family transcriptional regulator [Ideonella livida]|uniref:LysR family transcriptional regulator n=1 Tax=Ideonella livida TaxID=2707176 RepID=A0A7C9TNA9_9BURK|nr:LysR family transcriptional regulator [Ideonella livida]NDY93663.1 LysR family transcriptional regulator [Ideonella livida]